MQRWVSPLGWDDIDHDEHPIVTTDDRGLVDEIAVELLIRGDHTGRPRRADREEAARRMHARGAGPTGIARRL